MMMPPDLTIPRAEVEAICRRYQIRELALFGSAARGELKPDSDVDLLVDFQPQARVGLLALSAMADEFSALFGRGVDIAIKPALKPRVRSQVLADARTLYAA